MKQDPRELVSQIPNLTIAIVCDPKETALQFQLARTFIGERHRYIHHGYQVPIISQGVQLVFLIGNRQFHDYSINERIAIAEVAFAKNPGMLLTRTPPGREMALWMRQRNKILQRNLWPILSDIALDIIRLLDLEQLPSSPH